MLGIKGKGRWQEWHVNETVPDMEGQVVTFQADGHELDLILIAMGMQYNYDGTIGAKKPRYRIRILDSAIILATPECPKCHSKKLSCHANGCTWTI